MMTDDDGPSLFLTIEMADDVFSLSTSNAKHVSFFGVSIAHRRSFSNRIERERDEGVSRHDSSSRCSFQLKNNPADNDKGYVTE